MPRVMIQLRSTPALATTSFGFAAAAPQNLIPGVQLDPTFSPVPLPSLPAAGGAEVMAEGVRAAAMSSPGTATTYLVRGAVAEGRAEELYEQAQADPNGVVAGVFADPQIQAVAPVCPGSPPRGTDADVELLLALSELQDGGCDGAGVRVVVVDTGINFKFLHGRGKSPGFDPDLSWGPTAGQDLGAMPVGHGTMCAYDVCIAAPLCTLVDHAVLTSRAQGGSAMDGLLSDAVASYGILLSYLLQGPGPFAGDAPPRTLVVTNSWGMFHPSWDFPVGHPANYSANPNHPFNLAVGSLEAAGADVLFAAGNCGSACPDGRCRQPANFGPAVTDRIYGANSHPSVLCVAGVSVDDLVAGYSTRGPGLLDKDKPDVAGYTHFAGSGVYPADGGTSAATPVVAGVVAAVRRRYPSSLVSPSALRDLIRQTAHRPAGTTAKEVGSGVINVSGLLAALQDQFGAETGTSLDFTALAAERKRAAVSVARKTAKKKKK